MGRYDSIESRLIESNPMPMIEVQPHFHAFMPCELPEVLFSELAVSDSTGEDARNSPSSPNGMGFSFVIRVLFFTRFTYFQCAWAYLPKLTQIQSEFASLEMCPRLDL